MTEKKINVTALVTGVGAIIGQGIIKSLRKSNYAVKVVGIDKSKNSPGPYLCDVFYQKPLCGEDSSEYLAFWCDVLQKECVDIVLVGLEVDMFFLDKKRDFFSPLNVDLVLNNSDLISLSADKWKLHESLLATKLPRIPTVIPNNWNHAISELGEAPLLLKPRHGNGSRGIIKLYDERDFKYWNVKLDNNWMLQRIVGDENNEFTVGIFGFGNGESSCPIIFKRVLSSSGNTLEAVVVNEEVIENVSNLLTKYFKPLGPTNYQFRMEDGCAYLLEINPRFSSSNSLRTAFNYNEAEMAIDYFKFNKISQNPIIKKGSAWRYSEDYIKYDCDTL